MVKVPVRELVLVFAVTDQLTVPVPVAAEGVHVSHSGALLAAVQTQEELEAVTAIAPLAEPYPGLALVGARE